ncbi:transcriptional regulator [Microtetraspora malaysiensis]|uniref:transcriptional regulator n=1 Tax=Microtetraspora malaysiensis TaxID=161358 RepID=UPI003D934C8C
MSAPFEELAGLDKLIHEPARLAITTALAACERADFLFLQRLTGLSKGNLSAHLSKLEAGGLVEISKEFAGKHPRTWVGLTESGRRSVEAHWEHLNDLQERSRAWAETHHAES